MKLLKVEKVHGGIIYLIQRENLQVGDRLPTEFELCETFDVSRVTLRRAIDGLVADGILQRNGRSGTKVIKLPDQGNAQDKIQKQILFVYFSSQKNHILAATGASAQVYQGLEKYISTRNDTVLIQSGENLLKMTTGTLKSISGIVIGGNASDDEMERVMALSIPIISFNPPRPNMNIDFVSLDSYKAGYMASSKINTDNDIRTQLYIGYLYDTDKNLQVGYAESRRGVQDYAQSQGNINTEYYYFQEKDVTGENSMEAFLCFLVEKKVDGIVCCSYMLSSVIQRLGKIEPRLFSKLKICLLDVEKHKVEQENVSYIHLDHRLAGYHVAKRLYEILDDPASRPLRIMIPSADS